jgi:hypothetical protein
MRNIDKKRKMHDIFRSFLNSAEGKNARQQSLKRGEFENHSATKM